MFNPLLLIFGVVKLLGKIGLIIVGFLIGYYFSGFVPVANAKPASFVTQSGSELYLCDNFDAEGIDDAVCDGNEIDWDLDTATGLLEVVMPESAMVSSTLTLYWLEISVRSGLGESPVIKNTPVAVLPSDNTLRINVPSGYLTSLSVHSLLRQDSLQSTAYNACIVDLNDDGISGSFLSNSSRKCQLTTTFTGEEFVFGSGTSGVIWDTINTGIAPTSTPIHNLLERNGGSARHQYWINFSVDVGSDVLFACSVEWIQNPSSSGSGGSEYTISVSNFTAGDYSTSTVQTYNDVAVETRHHINVPCIDVNAGDVIQVRWSRIPGVAWNDGDNMHAFRAGDDPAAGTIESLSGTGHQCYESIGGSTICDGSAGFNTRPAFVLHEGQVPSPEEYDGVDPWQNNVALLSHEVYFSNFFLDHASSTGVTPCGHVFATSTFLGVDIWLPSGSGIMDCALDIGVTLFVPRSNFLSDSYFVTTLKRQAPIGYFFLVETEFPTWVTGLGGDDVSLSCDAEWTPVCNESIPILNYATIEGEEGSPYRTWREYVRSFTSVIVFVMILGALVGRAMNARVGRL